MVGVNCLQCLCTYVYIHTKYKQLVFCCISNLCTSCMYVQNVFSNHICCKITVDNGIAPLEIRLAGNSILQGRVEILYYGIWGTICNFGTHFDLDSANVACRRLGFPGAARVLKYTAPGSGKIWLNRVQCVGDETSLEQCPHNGFGDVPFYCNHDYDLGVECLCKFLK